MKRFLLMIFLIVAPIILLSQDMDKTNSDDLFEEEVTYATGETVMNGYLVYNKKYEGERPGVLVVHEWWGQNEYARERARMLADLGYVAFALDMYGSGKVAEHPKKAQEFSQAVMSNMDQAKNRFMAALNVLKENPKVKDDDIAAIGYCFGGGVVLNMARMGVDLDGVVSFHGSLGAVKKAEKGNVKAKVLVFQGADDKFVTDEQIKEFKKEMDDADVDYEFIEYPNTLHSFTNPAADSLGKKFDLPLAYNPKTDKDSWIKMQEFFDEIFESD